MGAKPLTVEAMNFEPILETMEFETKPLILETMGVRAKSFFTCLFRAAPRWLAVRGRPEQNVGDVEPTPTPLLV